MPHTSLTVEEIELGYTYFVEGKHQTCSPLNTVDSGARNITRKVLPKLSSMDADSCSRCRFYHGASGIVCALHPSGPVEDPCGDWMPGDDLKRLNRLELLQC